MRCVSCGSQFSLQVSMSSCMAEPLNMCLMYFGVILSSSSYSCAACSGFHCVQIALQLKAAASWNISVMSTTSRTSQSLMHWLKAEAYWNIAAVFLQWLTFQSPMGWLKVDADSNIRYMV